MRLLQRILRIPLKSFTFCTPPQAGYGQNSQHPVLNENSSEVRQNGLNTEYSPFSSGNITFYGFFLACICSLFMFCAPFPQETTCRVFPLGFS